MRPVRRPSQARSSPVSTNLSPQITQPIPSNAESTSPNPISPQVPPRGVRYVDVRVAIPAESPFPQEGSNDMMQFMHPQSPSPMTIANSSTGGWSPIPTFDGRSHATSPFGFVPIEEKRGGRFTPPISQYTFHKPGTVSPSMMSILTEDTSETASLTIESSSRISGSPATFHLQQQQQQQQAFHNRRSPSPSFRSKTPTGRMSPFLKSTDDDPIRKSRIKTELCMHYSSGRPCPFGAQCTYAHGEEELQMTKLVDLHEAGLVDKETYRIKPCLTWVATGSCPFGRRCSNIHDYRVSGHYASWLPHTETQGNNMATDINVEALHQKRHIETLTGNPFGISLDDSWSDLYKLVCNINYVKNGWVDKKRQRVAVNPIVKLQIALIMRGDAEWQYKYRPQHIIHDELCMVLQKRAFYVSENDLQVTEISVNTYNPRNSNHLIVREIAFGPDCDPTVRGVALWFNIREDDVIMCTPQQAKRYRWKRSIKIDANETTNNKRSSAFDSLDSFAMIRPHDQEAFDLATEMIRHRLIVTQTERISNMRVRFEALKKLEVQKFDLQKRFENLKLHWYMWAWPVNQGRNRVDKHTPVPEVDGKYSIGTKKHCDGEEEMSLQLGAAVRPIWNSFITNIADDVEFGDTSRKLDHSVPTPAHHASARRLPVFKYLAQGLPICEDRTLPHINKRFLPEDTTERPHSRQQERCWRALLLLDGNFYESSNEWGAVRAYFENSRSKKVLSIIQQK